MKNIKKHPILRVRKTALTERGRLSCMVIPNKKKEQNKNYCREKQYD